MPVQTLQYKQDFLIKKDNVLIKLINEFPFEKLNKRKDLYVSLMQAIVSQQLSVKAADTIWKRFLSVFPEKYPGEQAVLSMDAERFRSVGLSYQKANYLKNVAAFSLEKSLDFSELKKLNEEDLIQYLVQIKGVGRWTAEMILMFNLGVENIFPVDDLGIQLAVKNLYELNSSGKSLRREMLDIAENWSPYKTYVSMSLWKWKDKINKKESLSAYFC